MHPNKVHMKFKMVHMKFGRRLDPASRQPKPDVQIPYADYLWMRLSAASTFQKSAGSCWL